MNLVDVLHSTAERQANRPAVTDVRSGATVTYGRLAREAARIGAFLRARGVERGQRIALVGRNDAAHVAAAFGLLGAGACVVPLARTLVPAEVERIVRSSGRST